MWYNTAPISGRRGSEVNIDGLPDQHMGESADVEETVLFITHSLEITALPFTDNSWLNISHSHYKRLIDNINKTDKQQTILLTVDQQTFDWQKTDRNAPITFYGLHSNSLH